MSGNEVERNTETEDNKAGDGSEDRDKTVGVVREGKDKAGDEEEEEGEELLLYLEFADFHETSILTNSNQILIQNIEESLVECKVVGPSSKLLFSGEHQRTLGTCHFYQCSKRSRLHNSDLQYLGPSDKKTKFTLKNISSTSPAS
jgi:hypothetical protein